MDGLRSIDAATAEALAVCSGPIFLDGLGTLSDAAAAALATPRSMLSLNGLTGISDVASKGLSQHQGSLSLDGLTTLDTDAAKALAATEKWNGTLSSVVALDSFDSIAIAKALAARQGRLAFLHLKRKSPKTPSALIEKRDVEIPLIKTLEFIQEPDGSLTADFIIPEWQEERQKQKPAAQAAE